MPSDFPQAGMGAYAEAISPVWKGLIFQTPVNGPFEKQTVPLQSQTILTKPRS